MNNYVIKLATLAVFSMGVVAAPTLTYAGGGDPPSTYPTTAPDPQPKQQQQKKKSAKDKKDQNSSLREPQFINGYKAAFATIYDRNDYAGAIDQLKSLGHDDLPDVANLIGYSYRKLGDYKVSQIWYERALKADPNHVRTWQYYGLWQLEQGNRDQASYHLNKIASLCGIDCTEYKSLSAALEKSPGTGLVY
jgi:tetratricopeptide (TPR) repeat protein